MAVSPSGEWDWAERWDELFDALAAEPRRMVMVSLLNAPPERRLPLPEAAASPNQSMDRETLAIRLRHHHLPKLANLGYVCWERDPFIVQRGPRFEDPALILELVAESLDGIPKGLVNNCKILQELAEDDSN